MDGLPRKATIAKVHIDRDGRITIPQPNEEPPDDEWWERVLSDRSSRTMASRRYHARPLTDSLHSLPMLGGWEMAWRAAFSRRPSLVRTESVCHAFGSHAKEAKKLQVYLKFGRELLKRLKAQAS
jgi:hypothetical protein